MRVKPAVRSLVTFRRINFVDEPWPMSAAPVSSGPRVVRLRPNRRASRPKPPPSSVTFTVTSSMLNPS